MDFFVEQGTTVCGDSCVTLDDFYTMGSWRGLEIKARDVKEIVGECLSEVDGVLALKGGLSDVFKKDEDLTRGISVSVDEADCTVKVAAKLITDASFSNAEVISKATELIASTLLHEAGLDIRKIEIDVAESLSFSDFIARYGIDRAIL